MTTNFRIGGRNGTITCKDLIASENIKVLGKDITVTGEEHAMDITYTGILSSGDSLVGLNVAVVPTGTAAAWVSGIYAKVTQATTKSVSGYISAAELEVVQSGTYNPADWAVLVLNSNNSIVSGSQAAAAYIFLRDYGSVALPTLLRFYDATIAITDKTTLLSTSAALASTHTIRMLIGTTPYWILLNNVGP